MNNSIIKGAYAIVYLDTSDEIEEVAKKITKGLLLPNIDVEHSEQILWVSNYFAVGVQLFC